MSKKESIEKMFSLKNKTIILTGSSGLLGTQFAHTLSLGGANVILVDIDSKKNRKLESELLRKYKNKSKAYSVDITNQKEVKSLAKQVLNKYKKIDGLVNNAAFAPRNHPKRDSSFEEYPIELLQRMINTNLLGTFICLQEIGKIMVKQRNGTIVNISSIYGMVGADQRIYGKSRRNSPASYATTKSGIINLSRYLAAYWNRKNVRVNTLTLGGVFNNQTKEFVKKYSEKTILGRMAKKDEYNAALVFLLSDASSYMTGANLVIDGGWTAW